MCIDICRRARGCIVAFLVAIVALRAGAGEADTACSQGPNPGAHLSRRDLVEAALPRFTGRSWRPERNSSLPELPDLPVKANSITNASGLPSSLTAVNADAQVRREVVRERSTLVDDQAAAASAAAALMHDDPEVREEAVRGLEGGDGETGLALLQQALFDAQPRVRAAAIETLSDRGGDDAIQCLALALNDRDAALREEAVYALGRIGGPTAIAVLQQALGDQQDSVREAAGDILAELEAEQRKRPAK